LPGKGFVENIDAAVAATLEGGAKVAGGAGKALGGAARIAGKLAPVVIVGILVMDYAEGGFTQAGRGFMMADEVESGVKWGVGQLGGNWVQKQWDKAEHRFDKYLDEDQ